MHANSPTHPNFNSSERRPPRSVQRHPNQIVADQTRGKNEPISSRKWTDLEAECDRSRRDDQSNLTEHRPSPLYGAV